MMNPATAVLLVSVLVSFLSGCSESNRATVTGAVTIDGQPVKSGSIAFFPIEEKLYNTADSPVQPIMKETLPAKYNDDSELQLDVKAGQNSKDFELSTK